MDGWMDRWMDGWMDKILSFMTEIDKYLILE